MQLSKSDYMMFLKQPAWLWLKKHDKTKLPPVNDNTQAIFDAGHMFESYAEQLFPNGITLGFKSYEDYLSLTERTNKALMDGAKTIFQGRFEHDQLTFICDIIDVINEREVDLYEIKSSTKVKPEHEYDLAFQMIVLEYCGLNVRNISVIHVNNTFSRQGSVNPKELTTITDVTQSVKEKRDFTKNKLKLALRVINSPTIPNISPGNARLGSFNEWLDIYKSLVDLEPYSIYDLCSINAEKISQLESKGITKIIDIPENFELSKKQELQIQTTKQNKVFIDKDRIKNFLNSVQYPIYFLDYETLMSIVPYFDGLKPYQQVPFQYSLHILDSPQAELRHLEYLHRENSNPAEPLSKTLKSQLGTSGSIFTWNMSFEKNCNDLLGKLVPKYQKFYEQLNLRILDLMIPFSKSWYVDKNFLGSASIKRVLPVLVPELSYKVLAIQEGGSAQRIWMQTVLDDKLKDKKDKILKDLVDYCKLDTLAMVEIYKQLLSIVS